MEKPTVAQIGGRVVITFRATGNSSGAALLALSGDALEAARGRFISKARTVPAPGGQQPGAYTLAFFDATGCPLFTIPARSTTDPELYDVPSENGKNFEVLNGWNVTVADLGAGKRAQIELIFF